MNRPELYKKTVDILYDAYFNDTLISGKCQACAVGNIVAANNGLEVLRVGKKVAWSNKIKGVVNSPYWNNVFCTTGVEWWGIFRICFKQTIDLTEYHGKAKHEIDSTGYNINELAKIERVFEKGQKGWTSETRMFNGLVAVLEVLKTIHEVEDNEPEVTRFQNHYNKKCLTNLP